MSPDGIEQHAFAETDGLATRLGGTATSVVALHPEQYAGTLSTLALGDLTLQVLRSKPAIILGRSSREEAGAVLVLDGRDGVRWNGLEIGGSDVALFGHSTEHAASFPNDFACMVLRFSPKGPNGPLVLPEAFASRQGEARTIMRASPQEHARMAAMAEALGRAPDAAVALRNVEARRSLRSDVLEATRRLIASAIPAEKPNRRPRLAYQRVVHAADAYLRANPARPIYTEDLCAALGISASRLAEAFHAIFDISPHRYLKMRRMSMVRAVLLSRSGPWHSVKAAALSHSFWHLGQFAHDYRAMYGEAPSATLARTLDGGADIDTDRARRRHKVA